MALSSNEQNSKFITTEPLGKSGQRGEKIVWDAVKNIFADRNCLSYWRYPIFSQVGNVRKEPDILIADFVFGLIVIEVKAVTIDQIVSINGHRWEFRNFYTKYSNPYEQAENQLFALLGYCDREPLLRRQTTGRTLVALPLITLEEWQQKGFNKLPSCPPIIFKNHLNLSKSTTTPNHPFIQYIQKTTPVIKGKNLNDEQWKLLLAVLGGTPLFRKSINKPLANNQFSTDIIPAEGTRGWVLSQIRQQLSELDLHQETIAKQIPPGLQRIRGIAGSGKTVLLCQKAAQMHLKYPDWEIALVFFSRSLYEPIIKEVNKWLRRFSSGEVQLNPFPVNGEVQSSKLKVLHAWGGKNQPGLYSTICEAANVKPLTVYETKSKQPHESLAEVCCLLFEDAIIPQIFDAILIDEGQDLIVDYNLKFQDKQPFYWMAYQALKFVDPQYPEQRRLIWAYDESQSLSSLNIPTASELFGDELGHLVTGQYSDGIKKSEIIHRCYRTPSQIVTVAHALSMGLLRPGGMLSGITRTEDWKAIGYEVIGRFTRGQKITLRRISEDFPNLISKLWEKPLLEFEFYSSRQAEFSALADKILDNLKQDALKPHEDILVVVLGEFFDAVRLENHVASFLMQQGINIFIPGATECNILKPDPEKRDRNKFWCNGGVTVSRIHRAKGHEADMVYVVGCDRIAQDESNITLRNQLFVALTRTRGWANLSGIGKYPFYEEIRRVIKSDGTFNFTFNHRPKREISVTDAGELLKRYAAGDRNFQGADLRGIQLAGADLSNANLINTQLCNADLSNAKLDGVKLAIADLTNANLTGASLRKAKFIGASLRDADLSFADLSFADLSDADLQNAKFIGANLNSTQIATEH